MIRRKRKPQLRIGKVTGCVRLSGEALEKLRMDCWLRDHMRCVDCGRVTLWQPRFDGDFLAYDMAHKKSRGARGSDTLNNMVTKCHLCHMKEHAGNRRDI